MHDGLKCKTWSRGLRHEAHLLAPRPVEIAVALKLLILLASVRGAWRENAHGVFPAPRMSKNRHAAQQAR